MRSFKTMAVAAALAASLLAAGGLAFAEDAPKPVDPGAATGDKAMDDLLAKEKEDRKACKIDICSVLRNHKADGGDINCHVTQTWPKKALNDMLSQKAHVSWPYSHAHCQTDINLKRATLVDAMTKPTFEAQFDQHTLTCDIERGEGNEKYTFKVAIAPKVTFENGKATKAEIHWGDVEAPLLAKTFIYPITGVDNKTNMLSSQFVGMVNTFLEKRCDEVKDQLKP